MQEGDQKVLSDVCGLAIRKIEGSVKRYHGAWAFHVHARLARFSEP